MAKKEKTLEPHKLVKKLMVNLARREFDDYELRSGNPSELFYLMSYKIIAHYGDSDFDIKETADGLEITTNGTVDINLVRKKLTEFINSRPNKNNYTFNQITNLSFLKDQPTSFDIGLLIKALEIGHDLTFWLDMKVETLSHVSKCFEKEFEAVEKAFLSEMNLPLNLFDTKESRFDGDELPLIDDTEDYSCRPVSQMRDALNHHPVWGAKYKAISARKAEVEKNILSSEDIEKFNVIGCMPAHIALLAVRATVTIDRMVRFNLDEKVDWLLRLNKLSE